MSRRTNRSRPPTRARSPHLRAILTLADLNGFKRYNDTFGHAAGDTLLRRLGRKLADACDGLGIAARLGGDEFCVLFDPDVTAAAANAILKDALSDEGEEFSITCSSGSAAMPEEAGDPGAALRLADSRMYAAKISLHPSPEQGMLGALTRMLDERHPGLGSHLEEVAALAAACAEELGIPSLDGVGALVRASHERWDGLGYPDFLAGTDIPLGARIIAVADAYCAMTEDRPYAQARSVESTCHELRAGAGTQFDAAVVTAFLTVLDRRTTQAREAVSGPGPALRGAALPAA